MDGFITPIIKAFKGKETVTFFTINDYQNWIKNNNVTGWNIKYYKGLGTSTTTEAHQYFSQID